MNDVIEALGGDGGRLLEVHTIDPIPGTVTLHRSTTGVAWVECEVNLTNITPPRPIVLRLDLRALQRLAAAAAHAETHSSTTESEAAAPTPHVAQSGTDERPHRQPAHR